MEFLEERERKRKEARMLKVTQKEQVNQFWYSILLIGIGVFTSIGAAFYIGGFRGGVGTFGQLLRLSLATIPIQILGLYAISFLFQINFGNFKIAALKVAGFLILSGAIGLILWCLFIQNSPTFSEDPNAWLTKVLNNWLFLAISALFIICKVWFFEQLFELGIYRATVCVVVLALIETTIALVMRYYSLLTF